MIDPIDTIHRINVEFSRLSGQPAALLPTGSDPGPGDDLVVCGVLGGKDVGKSTLVNALVKASVASVGPEIGPGTQRPGVYVHDDSVESLTARLQAVASGVDVERVTHQVDSIRNLVLIDLPDFDSEFEEHLRIVRRMGPALDRLIWVQTPRKLVDRAWVDLLAEVVRDQGNVFIVLNKVDQLLADGELVVGAIGDAEEKVDRGGSSTRAGDQRMKGAFTATVRATSERRSNGSAGVFWKSGHRWVLSSLTTAGLAPPENGPFLISAGFPEVRGFVNQVGRYWGDPDWSRYASEQSEIEGIAELATRELDQLRHRLLNPMPPEQVRDLRARNLRAELVNGVSRIREHFDVGRTEEQFLAAVDGEALAALVPQVFDEICWNSVTESLRSQVRTDSELADAVLGERIEHWPLLRLVYWPFGWFSRMIGRRILPGGGPTQAGRGTWSTVEDGLLGVARQDWRDRIAHLRDRFLADHASLIQRFRLEAPIPDTESLIRKVESSILPVIRRIDEETLVDLRASHVRPARWWRAGLWLIALWFPLIQPLTEGCLRMFIDTGSWDFVAGTYLLVSALSAPRLLAGVSVVVLIYAGIVAWLYARALRDVRRHRNRDNTGDPVSAALRTIFDQALLRPLWEPLERPLHRWQSLSRRLDSLITDEPTGIRRGLLRPD